MLGEHWTGIGDAKASRSLSGSSRWLAYRSPKSGQRLRMFCFPYAGGSASLFRRWVTTAEEWLDVCPVQLPGREGRWRETPACSLEPLVRAFIDDLGQMLTRPYMLFGYSMGALIAFEVARELRRRSMLSPELLVVAARRGPRLPDPRPPTYALPNDEFLSELRRFGGTSPEVLESPDLLAFYLPIVRADFALCDTYRYEADRPLACPIVALGGDSDDDVSFDTLSAWSTETSGMFTVRLFSGSHFFFHEANDALFKAILEQISTVEDVRR